MSEHIYICYNNNQEGPYSSDQLHDMIAKGAVDPITLAWKEGMTGWAPLNTIVACAERPLPTVPPPVVYAPPQPSEASPCIDAPVPKGVDAWLLSFGVFFTALGHIYSLVHITMKWERVQPAFAEFPWLKAVVILQNAGLTLLMSYGFVVGCTILNGNPNGREIAKKYLLIQLLGFIGIEFITLIIMSFSTSVWSFFDVVYSYLRSIFLYLGMFVTWRVYFARSKRVRNTYGAN
jgi:hypothetical protein